jgi:hypothetical protein
VPYTIFITLHYFYLTSEHRSRIEFLKLRAMQHSAEFFAQRGVKIPLILLLQQPLKQQYSKKRTIGDLAYPMAVKKIDTAL